MVTFEELPSETVTAIKRKPPPKPTQRKPESSQGVAAQQQQEEEETHQQHSNIGNSPLLSTTASQLDERREASGASWFFVKAFLFSFICILATCYTSIAVSAFVNKVLPSSWLQNSAADAQLRYKLSVFYVAVLTMISATPPVNMLFYNPMLALSSHFAGALSMVGLAILLSLQIIGGISAVLTFKALVASDVFINSMNDLISGPYKNESDVLNIAIILGFVTLAVCITNFLSSSSFFSKKVGSVVMSTTVAFTTYACGSLVSSNVLLPAVYRMLEIGNLVPQIILSKTMSVIGYWLLFWVAPLVGSVIGATLYPFVGLFFIAVVFGDAGIRRKRALHQRRSGRGAPQNQEERQEVAPVQT